MSPKNKWPTTCFLFFLFFWWYSRLATYYTLPGYRRWTYACNVDCFSAVLILSKPISNRNVKDHAWKWSIRALGHHHFRNTTICRGGSPWGFWLTEVMWYQLSKWASESSMKLPFRGPVRRFWWRSIATSASSLWRPKIFSIHWLKYVDNLYKSSIFPKPRTIRIFILSLWSAFVQPPTEATDPRKPNKRNPSRGVVSTGKVMDFLLVWATLASSQMMSPQIMMFMVNPLMSFLESLSLVRLLPNWTATSKHIQFVEKRDWLAQLFVK